MPSDSAAVVVSSIAGKRPATGKPYRGRYAKAPDKIEMMKFVVSVPVETGRMLKICAGRNDVNVAGVVELLAKLIQPDGNLPQSLRGK